jgi:hypothetical protein
MGIDAIKRYLWPSWAELIARGKQRNDIMGSLMVHPQRLAEMGFWLFEAKKRHVGSCKKWIMSGMAACTSVLLEDTRSSNC